MSEAIKKRASNHGKRINVVTVILRCKICNDLIGFLNTKRYGDTETFCKDCYRGEIDRIQ